jgi:vacuolar-type H+-ATPase subunit I/STV1
MIVPMKKVSVVILEKYRKEALSLLRDAGVLHLETEPTGSGETLDSLA